MAKILLVTDNKEVETVVQTTLLDHEFLTSTDVITILDIMKVESPDIVMFDSDLKIDLKSLFRELKNFQAIILLLVGEKSLTQDIISNTHLFISKPINATLLKSTIEAGLKVKKTMTKLAQSNRELANSLYQLNVLYNSSSKLAGSLSRDKLIDELNEGLDKALNSNISCTLSFKDDKTPVLLINSNYKLLCDLGLEFARPVEKLKIENVNDNELKKLYKTEVIQYEDLKTNN